MAVYIMRYPIHLLARLEVESEIVTERQAVDSDYDLQRHGCCLFSKVLLDSPDCSIYTVSSNSVPFLSVLEDRI